MKSVILVHGLTGTPMCVEPLKNYLLKRGFEVITPCLAGHGTTLKALEKSTWQDWYETVRVAYSEALRSGEKVFYAGISLGALLGLKLAIDEGWTLTALALLSTPLRLPWASRFAVPLVKYSPARFAYRNIKKDFEKSVEDKNGRLFYMSCSHNSIPARSIFEVVDLQRILIKNLKRVKNPLICLHARRDKVSPLFNVRLLKGLISSETVEEVVLEKSGHVMTLDIEKDIVSKKVADFFEKF